MASNIKFKRSAVQNRVPTTAQLDLGELALNTYDGKLYTEINTGSAAVVEIGSKLSSLVVDGANGAGGGDVVFHGTTAGYDLTWDYSDNSLKFADNAKAKFGAGGDLSIYHDGNNNYIDGNSVAEDHIYIRANVGSDLSSNIHLQAKSGEESIVCRDDEQVELYYNGNLRLTTTVDGADISGTGSLKIPVGTTAQRSASPVAGDLRYNTTTGGFEGYSTDWGELGAGGIGVGSDASNPRTGIIQNRVGVGFTDLNIVGAGISVTGYGTTVFVDFNEFKPGSFHRTIHNYTATAGQTTFAGLNYEVSAKQIAVYLNGARLSEATYTATSGTTVVLDVGASVGDEVEIINIHTNSDVDRKVNTYTATAGQTTFTGLSYNSKTELDVYLNGIRLASDDFTATSGNTVVLAVGASVNDTVDIVSTGDGVTWRSTTDASGDVYKLTNVGIGTDQTPDKLNVRGNVNIVGVVTATTFVGALTGAASQVTATANGDNTTYRVPFTSAATGSVSIYTDTNNGMTYNPSSGTLSATSFSGDGSNLTNTGSTLSEPSSGTQRLVTTSLTTGTMTSSGTGSELTFDYANNLLKLTDSTKINLGTGGDMFLFHNGSNSYVQDAGTGVLFLDCSETNITKFGSNHNMAKFIGGGAVELYHNNSKKFETTSTGASVTGNLAVSGVLTYDDVTNVDSVGIITAQNGIQVTSGDITMSTAGNIILGDSGGTSDDRLVFGNDTDMVMYHNGTHAVIENTTGNLHIKDDSIKLQNSNATTRLEVHTSGVTVTGNISVSGTVDGRDVATDGSKLDGIEASATADQSASEILTLIKTVDGSGSGLDADLLDGLSVGSFVRADADDTLSGVYTISDTTDEKLILASSSNPAIRFQEGTTNKAKIQWNSNGYIMLINNETNEHLRIASGNNGLVYQVDGSDKTVWHSGNDGAGSGLDADTLDGISSASFLRSDANDTTTGVLTLTSSTIYPITINGSNNGKIVLQGSSNPFIRWREGTTDKAYIQWNSNGNFYFVNQETGEQVYIASGGNGLKFVHDNTTSTVWHAGNDGSGTGLDADTLDGVQGSSYVRSDATDTLTGGTYTLSSSTDQKLILQGSSNPYIRLKEGTTEKAYWQFNSDGHVYFWNQESNKGLRIGTAIHFYDGSYGSIWHANNDGSGSGLDSDTVDGIQASSFLRSDTSDTASGEITFSGSIQVANSIVHQGDGDTRINFGTDTIELDTAGTQRMSIISNGDVLWNSVGTATPGHGNTTQGMGFEPRNGSIFLSRDDNGTLFSNRNNDGSQIGLKRSGTDKFHIGLFDSGATFRISSGNMGSGTSRLEIDTNGHTRATVRARTFVTTYKTSVNNLDGCLTGGDNNNDCWIYNFFDNAIWGIYHRNIDSTLTVNGFGLPSNSTAFIGNGNLKAYINHDVGTICSTGGFLLDGESTATNQALGIRWSGFDKEGTSDRSDIAGIIHTTNQEGLVGGVLRIFSDNDDNDGVVIKGGNSPGAYGTRVINGLQVRSGALRPTAGSGTDGIIWPTDPFGGSGDVATIQYYRDGSGENTRLRVLIGNDGDDDLRLEGAGGVHAQGNFTKSSGNFRIPHVLAGLTTTTDLVHSFVEGPQADNLYRGRATLVAGISTVNIDTTNNMTDGTFVNLNRDVQCFTSNETGWTAVKGSVTGNLLTIVAQDNTCTDTISWMVVGERWDLAMYDPKNSMTDENGKVRTEVPNRSYVKGFDQDYISENQFRVGISTISRPSIENKEVE